MLFLKQSTAYTLKIGPFLDSTDGNTEEGALGLVQADIRLSKNGGNFAQKNDANAPVYDETGMYECQINATDTDTLGRLQLAVHKAGSLIVWHEFHVVPANVYDSLIAGSDYLQTDAMQIEGADATDQIGDATWDEILTGATHNIATSAGRRLRELGALAVASGTSTAGGANTITLEVGSSAVDQIYTEDFIVITGGTGIHQVKQIVEYVGATRVATVDGVWAVNPDNTSEYQILAEHDTEQVHHGRLAAGAAGTATLDAGASAINDYYNTQMLHIVSGLGYGQVRQITAYNGATKVATITPNWATTPDNTSIFHICMDCRKDVSEIEGVDATDQIRDAVLSDSTPFDGADVAAIRTVTDLLPDGGALTTLLTQVLFIYYVNHNRWRIQDTPPWQMIFYENDNVTPVATFNLLDIAGNPADPQTTPVTERMP